MWNRCVAVFLFIGMVAGVFSGCSDEPTQLNALVSSLPLSDMLIRDTTIAVLGSTNYRQNIPYNGAVNLVGQAGDYTAYASIEFYPSTFPIRDTALVFSARLILNFHQRLPDPARVDRRRTDMGHRADRFL
jgi:hypothetical protein